MIRAPNWAALCASWASRYLRSKPSRSRCRAPAAPRENCSSNGRMWRRRRRLPWSSGFPRGVVGKTFQPDLQFLRQASQLPGLFVMSDDDECGPTQEAMEFGDRDYGRTTFGELLDKHGVRKNQFSDSHVPGTSLDSHATEKLQWRKRSLLRDATILR